MSSLNKAMIIGRLGQDPEIRYTQSQTAVANLSIATSEKYKDSAGELQETTEWHRVVAWGRLAEICQEYLKKGSQVYIEGPIQTRQWEDNEGNTRYSTEVKALTLTMLDSKKDGSGGGGNRPPHPADSGGGNSAPSQAPTTSMPDDMDDIDDDLPF